MNRERPRRNRKSPFIRTLVRENVLTPHDLVLPLFLIEGKEQKTPIRSMPGVFRLSLDNALKEIQDIQSFGIKAVALFPSIENSKKDSQATESAKADSLLPRAIREIKSKFPELVLISDVAMDPYSSDGHDGLVENGQVLNDPSLEILAQMALVQAQAGADIVAPSDMMDGRVSYIRQALDQNGHTGTSILSYTAKYCSSFYGPFREALDSAPKSGDKKTYQMDPSNSREALRELRLDLQEGADIIMVKPAHTYLDIIAQVKAKSDVPVAAYQVSGEYSMICAAAEKGFLNLEEAMMEALYSIKRAGADLIFSYYAPQAAKKFNA